MPKLSAIFAGVMPVQAPRRIVSRAFRTFLSYVCVERVEARRTILSGGTMTFTSWPHLPDMASSRSRAAEVPSWRKSGRTLESEGTQFSQISGSSSTDTTAISSGMRTSSLAAADTAAAPIMSVTAKIPHGRGRCAIALSMSFSNRALNEFFVALGVVCVLVRRRYDRQWESVHARDFLHGRALDRRPYD